MKAEATSRGTLALIATAALWGSNHVAGRAVRETVPLPALVFWRWVPAAIILTIIAWPALRQGWPAIRAQLGGLIVGGVVGVGLFSYCLLGGAYQSLAIEVGFINATTPVWVLLLGRWMGEAPLTAMTKWGVALAFAGTLLIITKGKLETLTQFQLSLGNLWSLIAAIAFAWFSIRVRDWSRTIASLPLMVVTGWAGLLVVMTPAYLIWVALGGPWFVWNDADMGFALTAVSYMGLAPTMLGNLFYLYGVAVVGAARAAAFLYLSPLFSAGLSILWLGEQLAWYHLAGIAAIFAGLLISGKSRPARLRPEPVQEI
jgi:drug/metabolite transporter (DMT)-like permease